MAVAVPAQLLLCSVWVGFWLCEASEGTFDGLSDRVVEAIRAKLCGSLCHPGTRSHAARIGPRMRVRGCREAASAAGYDLASSSVYGATGNHCAACSKEDVVDGSNSLGALLWRGLTNWRGEQGNRLLPPAAPAKSGGPRVP